jgi:hypothetical protein
VNIRRLVGLAVLAATMMAASGDPFAVGLAATVSLTLLVGLACANRWPRTSGSSSVSSVEVRRFGRVKDLHPMDHDCPVALSVIRR